MDSTHHVAAGFLAPITVMGVLGAIASLDTFTIVLALALVAALAVLVTSYLTLTAAADDPTRHWPIAAILVAAGAAYLYATLAIPASAHIEVVASVAIALLVVRRRAVVVLVLPVLAAAHAFVAFEQASRVARIGVGWLTVDAIVVAVLTVGACAAQVPYLVRWFRTPSSK